MNPLLADWPTKLDLAATISFLVLVVTVPAVGYAFMIVDFRAYLRSLTRTLVRIVNYLPHIPTWAYRETPRPLAVFGLHLPCNEEDLLKAYRTQVKKLHPDRGGDKQRFLLLQSHFEEALKYLRQLEAQLDGSRDPA